MADQLTTIEVFENENSESIFGAMVKNAFDKQAKQSEEYPEVRTRSELERMIMDLPSAQQAAVFFKGFGDSTRIRILHALSVRELCVSDLCQLLEVSQPAVSNHLRVLGNQRMVKYRRSGKNVFYSLDGWHINAIIGMGMEYLGLKTEEEMEEDAIE